MKKQTTNKGKKAVSEMTVDERLKELQKVENTIKSLKLKHTQAAIATNRKYEEYTEKCDREGNLSSKDWKELDNLVAKEKKLDAKISELQGYKDELLHFEEEEN